MSNSLLALSLWIFGSGPSDKPNHLWPRWLWLRALGLIFFSAFYSLIFQIRGLIGPNGILPAIPYLRAVAQQLGLKAYWFVPSLLWFGASDRALTLICWIGLLASILLVLNLWPRGMITICLVLFLSFVSTAQDFSSYQSDGMLLEAGFISVFLAPPGWRPSLGESHPASRASLFLLQWEWFRIYFESGIVKMASHDPQWRHLTALDHYYENGPLPDWIGWYVQQLPHGFHAATTILTLMIELGLVWMLFLPRRFRLVCFFIVTPFQIGIILTANLAFLNYLVLTLGILLLDDRILRGMFVRLIAKTREAQHAVTLHAPESDASALHTDDSRVAAMSLKEGSRPEDDRRSSQSEPLLRKSLLTPLPSGHAVSRIVECLSLAVPAFFLSWIIYDTMAFLLLMLFSWLPLPMAPIIALEPFRIANEYGLFAVMTKARYEIEFQGTRDGETWIAYPFRYKPQNPREPPKLFAPYQPRFDWNLWFASLGNWREYPFVAHTEVKLLQNSREVLSLFAGDPFGGTPPRQVRAMIWQYWFTDLQVNRTQGIWWRRELRGLYAPVLERESDGSIVAVEVPETGPPPP